MHSLLEHNVYIGGILLYEVSLVRCPSLHLRECVLHSLALEWEVVGASKIDTMLNTIYLRPVTTM